LTKKVYQIIDANINRSREGLRVVEEVARFILEDSSLTKKLKEIRHAISNTAREEFNSNLLFSSRDSEGDIGASISLVSEGERYNTEEILNANVRRAQEAVRVLEEFGKVISSRSSQRFKAIRFELYKVEKELNEKLRCMNST
jgi:thiamine-phosphate pyrophosphorylase